jgi:hypothetical protein
LSILNAQLTNPELIEPIVLSRAYSRDPADIPAVPAKSSFWWSDVDSGSRVCKSGQLYQDPARVTLSGSFHSTAIDAFHSLIVYSLVLILNVAYSWNRGR